MRPIIATACAALLATLTFPATGLVTAGPSAAPPDAVTDVSAARKKEKKKRVAPKEEYLRAAPMTPAERVNK